MGFQLFTSSGTFNPASWGLKAGDILQIVCVGGGGGGGFGNQGYNSSNNFVKQGSNGSASSFGSVVSASGGNGGVAGTSYGLPAYQESSNRGSFGDSTAILGNTYYNLGAGGDGWYPGFISKAGSPWWMYVPWSLQSMSSTSSGAVTTTGVVGVTSGMNTATYAYKNPIFIGVYGLSQYTATTTPYGGIGYSGIESPSAQMMQIAGFGYGAGGAGGNSFFSRNNYQSGGNSGQIKIISYALPSTSTIAVTVGNGGNGGYAGTSYQAGGGARGCVAVYW